VSGEGEVCELYMVGVEGRTCTESPSATHQHSGAKVPRWCVTRLAVDAVWCLAVGG